MKIDDQARIPDPVFPRSNRTAKARKASKAYASPAATPVGSAGSDRVEVSDAGRARQAAAAALEQTPSIRADKVADLKARIKAGTYQVPGEAIAERMLAEEPPE